VDGRPRGLPRRRHRGGDRRVPRTEDRRPTPARIRKLCVKHAPRPPAPRFEPKTVEPSTEQKARIREMTGRAFLELRRFDETPTPRHPIHSGLE
jgi:hypothetical protein